MNNNIITDDEEFRCNKYGNKYLYSINRNTFETESSSNIYKKHFSGQLFEEESLYIIFGSDSGLLAHYILEQEQPTNTRYLFIELPHLIEKIKQTLPQDYDKKNILFSTPEKWKAAAEALEITVYIYKDSVHYIKSFAALSSYQVDYHNGNLAVVKALEIMFFFTRALVGVFPFMTKQLMNICENRSPSTLMNNLFKGKTCVILGGGPSLDNDIEWLKDNKKNLVIIAVSRIAKNLLKHNLIPHIIVAVDPYEISFDVSKDLLKLPKDVLFLHANCVYPSLLSQWHGKSVFIGQKYPWNETEEVEYTDMGGPTVTNTALKAAIEMGFSNVLLSGVDLCNSKTGVSHASGSNEANIGPALGQAGVWVETYAGHKAETSIAFDNAVAALSKQAYQALEQEVSIYNLSENAAKAKYIEHITTAALSFEDEQDNVQELINSVIPDMNIARIKQSNNIVLKNVTKILKDVKAIKLLAEECLECNKKLFSVRGKEEENFKYKIRMDKIEKQFDKKYKNATSFVKNFGLDQFIKCAQTSDSDWSDDKIETTGQIYYQAYVNSSKSLIQHLSDAVQRINSRIEESKPAPNFSVLYKQWQKDKQFGRAIVFKESTNIELENLKSDQKNYDECLDQYEVLINKKDTLHLTRTKREASLAGVKRKITILFNQHNIDALEVMMTSLSMYDPKNPQYQQAQHLFILAEAFLLILQKDYNNALYLFDQLPIENIEEDELQQIASLAIKLGDYEQAESSLRVLASISTIYVPKYAKILNLLGKSKLSIDTYTQYLSDKPKDIQVWFELAKLYFDLNFFESATLAFEQLLIIDPKNLSAIEYLNKLREEN
jgi:hypothetical protein